MVASKIMYYITYLVHHTRTRWWLELTRRLGRWIARGAGIGRDEPEALTTAISSDDVEHARVGGAVPERATRRAQPIRRRGAKALAAQHMGEERRARWCSLVARANLGLARLKVWSVARCCRTTCRVTGDNGRQRRGVCCSGPGLERGRRRACRHVPPVGSRLRPSMNFLCRWKLPCSKRHGVPQRWRAQKPRHPTMCVPICRFHPHGRR